MPDSPASVGDSEPEEPSERVGGTARAVVALAAAEVVGKVATFAVMIAAARVLGQSGFGHFALALTIALVVQEIASWGFETLLTRDGSRDRSVLATMLADLVVLRALLMSTILGVGAAVLALRGEVTTAEGGVLLLLLLSVLLDAFSSTGRAAAAALGQQARVALALIVQRLLGAAVSLIALGSGAGLLGLGAGFVLGSALGAVVVLRMVACFGVPLRLRLATRAGVLGYLRGSGAIGMTSAVNTALFRVDAILLGIMAGTAAVGRYSAAYRLLETVMFVNWAVARAVFPLMSSASGPRHLRRVLERGLSICGFVFVPYAAVLLLRGEDLLRLLFGEEFAGPGAVVLRWLAPAPLLFGICFLAAHALYAADRPREVLRATCVALGVNVAANLVLIPQVGEVGAAVATTGSFAVQLLLLGAPVAAQLGWPRLSRTVLVPALATLPTVGVLLLGGPLLLSLAVAGVMYVLAWVPLAAHFDPEPLQVVRDLVRR